MSILDHNHTTPRVTYANCRPLLFASLETSTEPVMDALALENSYFTPPIIITDYDRDVATRKASRASDEQIAGPADASRPDDRDTAKTSGKSSTDMSFEQATTTGFADVADELWSKMTFTMKSKLREACVEVLKRTDAPSEEEKLWAVWDEDARLLD